MPKAKRKRTINKLLRLNEEEARALEEKAKERGMNESAYLRMLIYQNPRTFPEIQKLLRDMNYQIYKFGVDVNQIAKHLNSGGRMVSEDKERILSYMMKLRLMSAKVVEEIGNCKNDSHPADGEG